MDGVEGTQAGIGVSYSNSFDWMVSRQIRIFTINMGMSPNAKTRFPQAKC